MSRMDNNPEDLLVSYFDQELSSEDRARCEQYLNENPAARRRLEEWERQRHFLKGLVTENRDHRRELSSDFSERVLAAASRRVTEASSADLAPWIHRTTESARGPQDRSGSGSSNGTRIRWTWGAAALAASLLAMLIYWPRPQVEMRTLLSRATEWKNQPEASKRPATPESTSTTDDQQVATSTENGKREKGEGYDSKPRQGSKENIQRELPGSLAEASPQATPPKGADSRIPFGPGSSKLDSTATLRSVPGSIDDLLINPKGTFLFVVDLSLPEGVGELDRLRALLDRYDIAWSDQLLIEESTRSKLEKSRLVAEAGKRGLLPDFVPPQSASRATTEPTPSEAKATGQPLPAVVSLIFVKARAARLDRAIGEVMQRVEDFPEFSFDLAFDSPTQALADELRYIQETQLPDVKEELAQVASTLTLRVDGSENPRGTNFISAQRRIAPMSREIRQKNNLPISAEILNPVAYALFVVRHSPPE